VSARLAVERLIASGLTAPAAVGDGIAAVSVGIVGGVPTLDLDYVLDSSADVDMNVVIAGEGALVEVQGTAEKATFTRRELDVLLDLAEQGVEKLRGLQLRAIDEGLANRATAK